jgi:predicted porin
LDAGLSYKTLSKRTNLYTSYSYPKNEDGVALATYNGAANGTDVKMFNVGMRHMF